MAGTATKDGLLAWLGQQDTEEAKSLVQLWGQVSGRCPQPTARAVAKELGTNLREGDGGKTDNFKQLSVLVEELRCKITTRASRLQAGDMERVAWCCDSRCSP